MAIQKTEGVLLRKQDLRETSLIVTFFTRDFGKIKGILRGVRGPRGQNPGGSLELFSYSQIIFYERRRGDIFTVSQVDLIDYFNDLRTSLDKLAYASYITELLDSVTDLHDNNVYVFELLLNCLRLLSGDASPRRVARIFEIKLLGMLGIMPELGACSNCGASVDKSARFSLPQGGLLCRACINLDKGSRTILPGSVRFMEQIRILPFDKAARIRVASQVGKEIETILRKFLEYHVDRKIKSLDFIKDIGC